MNTDLKEDLRRIWRETENLLDDFHKGSSYTVKFEAIADVCDDLTVADIKSSYNLRNAIIAGMPFLTKKSLEKAIAIATRVKLLLENT